jgi:hypothetical protein
MPAKESRAHTARSGAKMQFDDRLATVLRLAATGETLARIQYRQLLDLLGTLPAGHWSGQVDAAYLRLAELGRRLPAAQRAAMIAETGLRLRNPRLVSLLASAEPQVAQAAVRHAELNADQWLDLVPALPIAARATLHARAGSDPGFDDLLDRLGVVGRALPGAGKADPAGTLELDSAMQAGPDADALPAAANVTRIDEHVRAERRVPRAIGVPESAGSARETDTGVAIRAIVRRIEEFRKFRLSPEHHAEDAPRLPLDEPAGSERRLLQSFDFSTDAQGSVVWADGGAGPMLVGARLDREGTDSRLRTAVRRRLPILGIIANLDGAPAIAGSWRVDASPRFDPPNGRFTGYIGRMRRQSAAAVHDPAAPASRPVAEGHDRMRQILHELRTPVNGVQGCAELMQQAMLGPIAHEYRALAATIAAEAARILAAFDEFDRLVRLDAGTLDIEPGEADLTASVARTVAQLEAFTAPRGSGFALDAENDTLPVPFDQGELDALVWRILASLAGASAPGEVLRAKLRQRSGLATLSIRLPAQLAAQEGDIAATVPETGNAALSAGAFGTGFALRLAEAEARAAGGLLERKGGKLRLGLPGLTSSRMLHSHSGPHSHSG